MCGRYTLAQPTSAIAAQFQLELPAAIPARYNIAPTQPVLAVREGKAAAREPALLQWGLVPSWAQDPSIGSRMINARAETLAEKPAFRGAYKYRRCLLPADGFYEWRREGRRSVPYWIHLRDRPLFAFAGLWEQWERPEGYLETCAIVTVVANDLTRALHERMPLILPPDDYDLWLDTSIRSPDRLSGLLRSFPADEMTMGPVSPLVNSVANDDPSLIEPAPPDQPLGGQGALF